MLSDDIRNPELGDKKGVSEPSTSGIPVDGSYYKDKRNVQPKDDKLSTVLGKEGRPPAEKCQTEIEMNTDGPRVRIVQGTRLTNQLMSTRMTATMKTKAIILPMMNRSALPAKLRSIIDEGGPGFKEFFAPLVIWFERKLRLMRP